MSKSLKFAKSGFCFLRFSLIVLVTAIEPVASQEDNQFNLSSVTSAQDLIAQQNAIAQITGVQLIPTADGLEIILETETGQQLVPLILPEGNNLIIEILDATLVPTGNEFRETNPAPGIRAVSVTQIDESSIRLTITGENQAPSAEVVPSQQNLVLSVTPEETTAETEPDEAMQRGLGGLPHERLHQEEIEIIATGEGEDDYYVPDASTATRTDTPIRDIPASIQVVPREVIEDQGATNVREILRNVSGVTFSTSSGVRVERFVIRGFEANNFRNGFRDDFFSSRTQAELANIERVEVLKGPASVLFGRAEPSGIINFVTEKPLLDPYYELSFTAGDFNFYRPTLDFSGPLTADESLAYRLNVAYENAGSFRDGVQTERFFIAPTLTWQISSDTELTLEFSYLDDARPVDRGLVVLSDDEVADIPISTYLGDPEPREDFGETRTELYLDHRFNPNLSLRSALRYTVATESGPGATLQITGPSEDDRNFPVTDFIGDQFYETFTLQNDLIAEFSTGSIEHTVLLGLEYSYGFNSFFVQERSAGTIDIFDPDYDFAFSSFEEPFSSEDRQNTFGIYLQDQITLLDNFQLVVGGRFDTFNNENEDLSSGWFFDPSRRTAQSRN